MKLRITRALENKIKPAIFKYNLMTETPIRSLSSGACGYAKEGVSIQGGYLIKHKRELVGWAGAFENGEIHVFVRQEFRGKGGATKVIKRAKKEFPAHKFCPWTSESKRLFEENGANITYKYY